MPLWASAVVDAATAPTKATAANAIMTLRTMVFPPFAASTDSIRVSRVVDAYRP
jgi:hypothetical protein